MFKYSAIIKISKLKISMKIVNISLSEAMISCLNKYSDLYRKRLSSKLMVKMKNKFQRS